MSTTRLTHFRVTLALHRLRDGDRRPLLLFHGLGERAPSGANGAVNDWPGPVYALDFTGHGDSTVPPGGGYSAELLMADADVALAHLGSATVLGRGLGAYVALLLAGARPKEVRGAVLADGPGLAGGGPKPGSPHIKAVDRSFPPPPDAFALAELSHDVRPPDYATTFVRQATQLSGLEWPVWVAAASRPDWLAAVADEPGVRTGTVAEALSWCAASP